MLKKGLIFIVLCAVCTGCTEKLFISDHGSLEIIRCDLRKNLSGNYKKCNKSVVVTKVVDSFSASYLFTNSEKRKIYLYDDKKLKSIDFDNFDNAEIINESLEELSDVYYDESSDLFIGVTDIQPRLLKISDKGTATLLDRNGSSKRPYEKPTTVHHSGKTFVYWLDKPESDTTVIYLKRKKLTAKVDDAAEIVLTKEDLDPSYNLGELTYFIIQREDGIDYMYWSLNGEGYENDKIVKTNLETLGSEDWIKNKNMADRNIDYPRGLTIGDDGETIFFVTNGREIVGGAKKTEIQSPFEYSVLRVEHPFRHPTIIRHAEY